MTNDMMTRRSTMRLFALCLSCVVTASRPVGFAASHKRSDALRRVLDEVGGFQAFRSHLAFGNVFLAEVLSVLKEGTEQWGPRDVDNQVIVYRVQVERTFRGTVSGEITI